MKRSALFLAASLVALTLAASDRSPEGLGTPSAQHADRLAAYFQHETELLSKRCLADIRSLDDWVARRPEYRRQLQEMLGLWPMPARTDLKPVVTGRIEHDEFVVEKLQFQASPQLYVTANLWLPRKLEQPAPAILYVCGHSRVITNGVSCGNKTGYQHHGAWFARNGYVCLVIDTLQLGEIQGLHHGTYREGMWGWNSRGYTPAGVEAWYGIRALDYLCSRSEVDPARIGMTGRSGGGSYSWTVAALDDRVKVVAPIAGITDLQNQVVDGCVEGHCDCMFFVNTYRWDFPQLAALIAPRPLLLGNTDRDSIFPLDGVMRLHEKVRRIYRLYGETNKLGLLITEGPHQDTQDLQVPVFRWFDRWLKGQTPVIETAATKFFDPTQLKVFDELPADELNTKVQERFVPMAAATGTAGPLAKQRPEERLAELQQLSFGGWPASMPPLHPQRVAHEEHASLRLDTWAFSSQPHVELTLHVLRSAKVRKPERVWLEILDSEHWTAWRASTAAWADPSSAKMSLPPSQTVQDAKAVFDTLKRRLDLEKAAIVFFTPRDLVSSSGKLTSEQATHLRRRFMLLGQTLDGMRVWDIRCAIQAVRTLPEFKRRPLWLRASGDPAVNALYATLFEPTVAQAELSHLPASHQHGPDYLNVLKVMDIPDALALAGPRVKTR